MKEQWAEGNIPSPAVATTPHAVIADALTATGGLWFISLTNVTSKPGHGSPLSDQSDALQTVASNYSQPYSSAVCVPDSIHNISDSRKLVLPFLPYANPESLVNGNITYQGNVSVWTIEHPHVTYGHVLNVARSATDYRIQWIDLPQGAFSGSSIGVIILLPQLGNNAMQQILICKLSAGWGTTTLLPTASDGDTSDVSSKVTDFDLGRSPAISLSQDNTLLAEQNIDDFLYLPGYQQQLIDITKSWAKYLNPSISSKNTSFINLLMQQQMFPGE